MAIKEIPNRSYLCRWNLHICDTIEDTDRGLDKSWPLSKIVKTKVKKKTAR